MKKSFPLIALLVLVISSCQMNWDSGGKEELKDQCVNVDIRIIQREFEADGKDLDVEGTCDCYVSSMEEKFESYQDYLSSDEKSKLKDLYLMNCAEEK